MSTVAQSHGLNPSTVHHWLCEGRQSLVLERLEGAVAAFVPLHLPVVSQAALPSDSMLAVAQGIAPSESAQDIHEGIKRPVGRHLPSALYATGARRDSNKRCEFSNNDLPALNQSAQSCGCDTAAHRSVVLARIELQAACGRVSMASTLSRCVNAKLFPMFSGTVFRVRTLLSISQTPRETLWEASRCDRATLPPNPFPSPLRA